ncbi:MAG: 2OG-Fe(II) oxygenase [Xanthomonadaceae bacterium]|nr:2OG-Fe(II) oxygenase [Xanthomonadaceae bacterium]
MTLLMDRVSPASVVRQAPFPLLVAERVLDPAAEQPLAGDFPRYRGAGFFPHADSDCGPAINALVRELTAPVFADQVGDLLGIERLSQYPVLVTICRALNLRHGTIHTDSQSKVASALVYLNPDWAPSHAGCLRFLSSGNDIEALVAPEIKPVFGTLTAFRRTDNSFHGHVPYEGERRVIQIAWVVDAAAVERKTRRGRFSRAVKWVAGRVDGWFGRGRGHDAAHLD